MAGNWLPWFNVSEKSLFCVFIGYVLVEHGYATRPCLFIGWVAGDYTHESRGRRVP